VRVRLVRRLRAVLTRRPNPRTCSAGHRRRLPVNSGCCSVDTWAYRVSELLGQFAIGMEKNVNQFRAASGVLERQLAPAGVKSAESLERLRVASKGVITDTRLLALASRTVLSFKNSGIDAATAFETVEKAVRFATISAAAFGFEAEDAFQRISEGLARGAVLRLDDFGVQISEMDEKFKGMEGPEKKIAIIDEALRQMQGFLEENESQVERNISAWDKWTTSMSNAWVKMGLFIANAPDQIFGPGQSTPPTVQQSSNPAQMSLALANAGAADPFIIALLAEQKKESAFRSSFLANALGNIPRQDIAFDPFNREQVHALFESPVTGAVSGPPAPPDIQAAEAQRIFAELRKNQTAVDWRQTLTPEDKAAEVAYYQGKNQRAGLDIYQQRMLENGGEGPSATQGQYPRITGPLFGESPGGGVSVRGTGFGGQFVGGFTNALTGAFDPTNLGMQAAGIALDGVGSLLMGPIGDFVGGVKDFIFGGDEAARKQLEAADRQMRAAHAAAAYQRSAIVASFMGGTEKEVASLSLLGEMSVFTSSSMDTVKQFLEDNDPMGAINAMRNIIGPAGNNTVAQAAFYGLSVEQQASLISAFANVESSLEANTDALNRNTQQIEQDLFQAEFRALTAGMLGGARSPEAVRSIIQSRSAEANYLDPYSAGVFGKAANADGTTLTIVVRREDGNVLGTVESGSTDGVITVNPDGSISTTGGSSGYAPTPEGFNLWSSQRQYEWYNVNR
jgi:hypothetical protein